MSEGQTERQTAVLFADVSDSTKIYETVGDAAAHGAMDQCVSTMKSAVEKAGGRVVKTIGDEVMAVFTRADAAAAASAEMQGQIDQMPNLMGFKLGIRVGFHFGPVIQKDDDVFGDTVNLAARLVATAVKGQIITSAETVQQLGPMFRGSTRQLYAIQVKGRDQEVGLCELIWRRDDDATVFVSAPRTVTKPVGSPLRLHYHDKELVRRRDNDKIVLGRDPTCDMVLAETMASRQHCSIERRQGRWFIKDHSTNGTYVTVEGDTEVLLRREELALRKRGWIACGQPIAGTQEGVEFSCE